jgi:hypothetical protein
MDVHGSQLLGIKRLYFVILMRKAHLMIHPFLNWDASTSRAMSLVRAIAYTDSWLSGLNKAAPTRGLRRARRIAGSFPVMSKKYMSGRQEPCVYFF